VQLKKRKRSEKEQEPEPNADIIPIKKLKTSDTLPSVDNTIQSSEDQFNTKKGKEKVTEETLPNTTTTTTTTLNNMEEHKQEREQLAEITKEDILDINNYNSAEQLQEIGMDRLKDELQRRGMKCGGSVKERAERLFKVKGVTDLNKLDQKLFTKQPKK